jgi:hypothetical protein
MSGIADQFEVEPMVSYTGSYTDTVVFGEMFATGRTLDLGYTPLGISGSFNSRRLISSKIGRNPTHYMNNAWMPGWLVSGYVTGSFLGRPQRFQRFLSDSEYFFDSFIPNPVEIHLASGASLVGGGLNVAADEFANEHSGSFYGMRPVSNVALRSGQVDIRLRFLTYPSVSASVFPGVTASFVDTKWGPSFPMQSRYKNIERLFFFNGILPKSYTISEFIDFGGVLSVMSPPSSSNLVTGISVVVSGNHGGPASLELFGSLKRPGEIWPFVFLTNFKIASLMSREFTTFYFGFGDGVFNGYTGGDFPDGQEFRGFPKVDPALAAEGFGDDDLMYSHWVSPRGYRYGLKSSEPEHSSCVWRIGRFGQLRDMLEQRPFSKMREATDGKIGTDGPVKFVFLTGSVIYSQSLDYVTATNPTYNPRDSGIWDLEYKSGQPFADMDPVD